MSPLALAAEMHHQAPKITKRQVKRISDPFLTKMPL
jgi:hypothetical protein